jgi:hypothetical protein
VPEATLLLLREDYGIELPWTVELGRVGTLELR